MVRFCRYSLLASGGLDPFIACQSYFQTCRREHAFHDRSKTQGSMYCVLPLSHLLWVGGNAVLADELNLVVGAVAVAC